METNKFWSLWRLALLEYQSRGEFFLRNPQSKALEQRFENAVIRLQRFDRVAQKRGLFRFGMNP